MIYVYFILIPLYISDENIAGYWIKIGCSNDPPRAATRFYPTFEVKYKIGCKSDIEAKQIESILHTYFSDRRVSKERANSEVFYYTNKCKNLIEEFKKAQIDKLSNYEILKNAISEIMYPSPRKPLIFKGINYGDHGYSLTETKCIIGPSGKFLDTGVRGDFQINLKNSEQQKLIINESLQGVAI